MNYPPGYDDLEGPRARHFVAWSRRLAWLINRAMPGKRDAAVLLVANERTRASLPFSSHPDVRVLVENGVDLATWQVGHFQKQPAKLPSHVQGSLRLIFMGRLVPWKMVNLTLEAIQLSLRQGANVTLDVLGDGPERAHLEQLVKDQSLERNVRFHGYLPQAACAEVVADADALILNSVRECGGAVILEAMALGLPVIATDWGGPADYLDESCGMLISPVPRESFVERLGAAILQLSWQPDLRRRMGEAGTRKIVDQYDWEKKIDMIVSIYAEVASV
ncbi:glycosyltransferase family 4 protein [Rubellimicrobium rubrum]|nr:glycosyltransferase family 4 protein [Rubellimicrobium rubrum]